MSKTVNPYADIRVFRMCETRYLGPTNHRGSRVVAKHLTTGKRVTLPWQHELDTFTNHARTAEKCLGAVPTIVTSVDGGGYVFAVDPAARGGESKVQS